MSAITDPASSVIRGGCSCGGVKFEVQDRFAYVGFCHCIDCQRATGSAFTFTGAIAEVDLKVTAGAEFITAYAKSEETALNFCSHCGSHLFARKPKRQTYHVRIGVLERQPCRPAMAHIFFASRMPGIEPADKLARFDGYPPAEVMAAAVASAAALTVSEPAAVSA